MQFGFSLWAFWMYVHKGEESVTFSCSVWILYQFNSGFTEVESVPSSPIF
jgi:hypothetical protein